MGTIPCYQIKGPFNPKGQVIILPNIKPAPIGNQSQQAVMIAPSVNLGVPITISSANSLLTMSQTSTRNVPIVSNSKARSIPLDTSGNAAKTVGSAMPTGIVGSSSGCFVQGQLQTMSNQPMKDVVLSSINNLVKTSELRTVDKSAADSVACFSDQTAKIQMLKETSFSNDNNDNSVTGQAKSSVTENPASSSAVCVVTPDGKVKAISPNDMLTSCGSPLDSIVASDWSTQNKGVVPLAGRDPVNSGSEQKTGNVESKETFGGKLSSQEFSKAVQLDAELRKLDPQERNIVEIVRQLETESENRNFEVSGSVNNRNEQLNRPDSVSISNVCASAPKEGSSTYHSPDLEIPTISFSMISDGYNGSERSDEGAIEFDNKKTRDVLLTTLLTPKTPKSGAYGYGLGLDLEELFNQTNPQEL